MGSKVLVTGGAGFIGAHTCVELLAAGHVPVIVDDLRNSHERIMDGIARITGQRVALHRIDCTDAAALERVFAAEEPFTGAIHFAAYKSVNESVAEPLKYYANNVGSLLALLDVAARHDLRRIVFSSSCTVYGQAQMLPVDETAPADNATSPYGYTKVVCEHVLQDAKRSDDRWNVAILRYFNPVGAHPSGLIGELPVGVPNNLVPYVVQTAAGLRQVLTIHGNDYDTPDGTCLRDYIHVMDLARAHVKALELTGTRTSATCEVVNLGTGTAASVKEVVDTFERETGVKVPVVIGPRRPGDVPAVYADTTKSRRVLDWSCQFTLADALRHAWQWQRTLADTAAEGGR
ncbi:MAG TPA: UDP-glucose 4-epimerase GalE [Flavobacteriales bacterium]|jgi:UDP-glucose 4-epimerase|nr:UDP-glucose 4-epimerase GalE [Flavobacteriales bacterium]